MPPPTLAQLLKKLLRERQEDAGDLGRWWMDGIQICNVLHLNKDEVIERQAERGLSDNRLDLLRFVPD